MESEHLKDFHSALELCPLSAYQLLGNYLNILILNTWHSKQMIVMACLVAVILKCLQFAIFWE